MAEHDAAAEPANDPEPSVSLTADTSGAAVALALGRIGKDKGLNADAAEFLRKQSLMLDVQMEHLHEQRALQVRHLEHQEKHLRLRYFGDRLRIGLQLLGIIAGLAVVAFLGALAWSAYEDHGVTIEAFSVPPDLAQRGLTGQVAANQLLDRLAELQAQTVTSRPASSYANDWGGDIKVEIPETGVSIGELNRYLREWLGSETRISGEIVKTPDGIAVTARAGDASGRRFAGAEADIDRLIAQAAEAVYKQTQPYRYAVFLSSHGRRDEAVATFAWLARSGRPEDRAWAYTGWASILFQQGRYRDAARLAGSAISLNPRLQPAYPIRGLSLSNMGLVEADLAHARRELVLLQSGREVGLPGGPQAKSARIRFLQGTIAGMIGDFSRAAELLASLDPIDFEGAAQGYLPVELEASSLRGAHDIAAARRLATGSLGDRVSEHMALEDWSGLARLIDAVVVQNAAAIPPSAGGTLAVVYAHVGRVAEADAWASRTALDCYGCLMARGLIASSRRDWRAVDRWYAEAVRQGPSLPFAHSDWGQALLGKGDLDGAIAQLKQAHDISPHFADPVELWGEALMKEGDKEGAAAKFREADRYAPHWGRNHLRWGEALMLSGRYREARAQFEAASGMNLSKPDRAALDVLLARTAKGPLHG